MWIYFNKQGNLTAKIPHGEIIRQNSTFNFYITIDKEYFREFFNTSIKPFESYTLEQLVNKINETFEANLTILGVDISTSLTMEIKEFYKIKSTEITYNFEHGKQYLTYHYFGDHNLLTSSGTHEATLQLESKNNDIVKMLGNISFYVEKTYNTENNNINNGTIGGGGNGGNYELPIATPTILGGIKVGEGLNIGATGHLSVSEIYPTREEINDNFLAKDGGDLSGPLKVESNGNSQFISTSQDTAISVKGSSPNSYIKYVGSNGDLGYIGVNSNKKPVFYDSQDRKFILEEDLENALKDYLAKDGGTMSGPLVITGGDAATGAGNIQLDTNGHILAKGTTSTLLGRLEDGSILLVGHSSHNLKLRGSSTIPTYNDNNIALEKDIYKREELETYVSGVAENYISKDAVEIGDPANKVKFYGSLYEDEDTAIVNFDNKLGTFLGYEYKPTTIKSSSTLKWEDGNGKSNTIIDSSNIGSYAVSLDGDHNKQIRIRASIVPESGYSGLKLGQAGNVFESVHSQTFVGDLQGTANTAKTTLAVGEVAAEDIVYNHNWVNDVMMGDEKVPKATGADVSDYAEEAGFATKDSNNNKIVDTYLNKKASTQEIVCTLYPVAPGACDLGTTDRYFSSVHASNLYGALHGTADFAQHASTSDTATTANYAGKANKDDKNNIIHESYLRKNLNETQEIHGSIVPVYTNQFDLGSTEQKFAGVYATNFYGNATSATSADTATRASSVGTSSENTVSAENVKYAYDTILAVMMGTEVPNANICTSASYAVSAEQANKDYQGNIIHDTYLNAASSGNKTFAGVLLPSADNSGAIGHANTKFSQIYATNFYGTFNAVLGVQLLGRTSDNHTLLGNSSYKTYISSNGELYHRNTNTNKDVRILDTDNIGGYSLSLSGTDALQGSIVPSTQGLTLGSANYPFSEIHANYFHGDLNGTADFAQHASTSDTATTANYAGKANKDDKNNIIHESYLRKNLNETQEIHGSIVPVYTNQFDLGSTEQKFAGVYATNFYGNATSATSATKDASGNTISTTYWKKDDLVFSFNSSTGVLSITKK